MLIFEKAAIADVDEIADLYDEVTSYLESHINYPGWRNGIYPAREDAVTGVKEENLYIARDGEHIVASFVLKDTAETAYAQADWGIELADKEIFVVHTLAVHPRLQKSGIGRKIVDYIIQYSREQGKKAIRLDTYRENYPAISLYRKSGFQYIDTIDIGLQEFGLDEFELYQKLL